MAMSKTAQAKKLSKENANLLRLARERLNGEDGDKFRTKFQLLLADNNKGISASSTLQIVNGSVAFGNTEVSVETLRTFFESLTGVHATPEFRKFILSKAVKARKLESTFSTSRDLTRKAYDEAIVANLPPDYMFDEYEVCVRIMEMIQAQDEKRNLLNNGSVNLFYVRGYAVTVKWEGGSRSRWIVDAKREGSVQWPNIGRVFPRK